VEQKNIIESPIIEEIPPVSISPVAFDVEDNPLRDDKSISKPEK
jgi:hypothetical protein